MNIRTANLEDLTQISKLFWESDNFHHENQPNIYNNTDEPFRSEDYIKELIEDNKSMVFILSDQKCFVKKD